jgi:hypothetical protein
VNPEHLWLGTQKDNALDRENKGRGITPYLPGEKNGRAKLTWKKVAEIREMYFIKKLKQKEISRVFCITQPVVSRIVHNKTWKIIFSK